MQWLFIIANHYHVSKYFSSIEMTLEDNWFSTRLPHLKETKNSTLSDFNTDFY